MNRKILSHPTHWRQSSFFCASFTITFFNSPVWFERTHAVLKPFLPAFSFEDLTTFQAAIEVLNTTPYSDDDPFIRTDKLFSFLFYLDICRGANLWDNFSCLNDDDIGRIFAEIKLFPLYTKTVLAQGTSDQKVTTYQDPNTPTKQPYRYQRGSCTDDDPFLGEGQYAKVKAISPTGAAKRIHIRNIARLLMTYIDYRVLKKAEGSNTMIVPLLDAFSYHDQEGSLHVIFVLEQFKHDMYDRISDLLIRHKFIKARRIFAKAAKALADLHANQIRHGDARPENFLVSSDDTVYITDFGLSSPGTQLFDGAFKTSTCCYTGGSDPAPEWIYTRYSSETPVITHPFAGDVYSFCYTLVCKLKFNDSNEKKSFQTWHRLGNKWTQFFDCTWMSYHAMENCPKSTAPLPDNLEEVVKAGPETQSDDDNNEPNFVDAKTLSPVKILAFIARQYQAAFAALEDQYVGSGIPKHAHRLLVRGLSVDPADRPTANELAIGLNPD